MNAVTNSKSPAYPPSAQVIDRQADIITTVQPERSNGMAANRDSQKDQSPMRLRGGCIPCPVSIFLAPEDADNLSSSLLRMAAAASSSLVAFKNILNTSLIQNYNRTI